MTNSNVIEFLINTNLKVKIFQRFTTDITIMNIILNNLIK